MLKVKKIMESVIPQSYELSEGEKTAFKEMCNDGAMYYESTCNADRMFGAADRIVLCVLPAFITVPICIIGIMKTAN